MRNLFSFHSADYLSDSYYASLFGRYQDRRWAHTLILTGGWNDAKLNRTVNYGEGSYGTQGSTSGWGFGAMYELTYDVYLNENRSSVLQPLFNASVVTTRMDGYEETGAGNAGLNVGRQDWTTGTLALGGRARRTAPTGTWTATTPASSAATRTGAGRTRSS
ncbi:hypothetical protein CXU01_02290 [Akkermansia muciniphila]|uniref:autotransporter outer membrane beta-barrel domain-containing protein n=1 Tax=Akkermansia muciniphila TaxID=239935 RepID=UPI000C9BA41E|nr:autotransporter outer membrane beta-barrel domain-containing protein [Akkermansia muciniphila]PNC82192.1 hypothetical protein CXU01_02290 [Akkermansia muciniphila]